MRALYANGVEEPHFELWDTLKSINIIILTKAAAICMESIRQKMFRVMLVARCLEHELFWKITSTLRRNLTHSLVKLFNFVREYFAEGSCYWNFPKEIIFVAFDTFRREFAFGQSKMIILTPIYSHIPVFFALDYSFAQLRVQHTH
jgi:hypothetical protein